MKRVTLAGLISLLAVALLFSGASRAQPDPAVTAPPGGTLAILIPDISVSELMKNTINPSAQALWMAVSYVATETGTTETEPKTDGDWAALRKHAETLIKAGTTLMLPVLKIGEAQKGKTASYQYTPDEIAQLRQRNLSSWREYSQRLQTTTQQLLGAIDKHDIPLFTELGAPINQACEGCHAQFWYRP